MAYKKLKKIKVSRSALETLAARFGCTVTNVYNALAYRSNSERAEMIRQDAVLSFGGKEVMDVKFINDGANGKIYARGC